MPTTQDAFVALGDFKGGMPRSNNIPSNIIQGNLLSNTSWAKDCFVNQQFSARLQSYMIGYVGSIYSLYSVYK